MRRGFLCRIEATAAAEFAIIAPVLLLFLAGGVEFGRAFEVYEVANRLATQYAIVWADCSDVPAGTCASEASLLTAANTVTNVAPQLIPSKLSLTMFQVQMQSGTPVVTLAYPSGSSLNAAQTAAAQSVIPAGQYGVVVTLSYAHTLSFFSALMTPYLGSHLAASYTVVQAKS
jgi:Flp pilus assembly protein TadG